MNRLTTTFQQLRRQGKKALVTFITAGDPDLATTAQLVPALAAAGADIIELGIPFSDPMADGPTIQLASERALAAGTTLAGVLQAVREIRQSCQVPLVLMGYYNPVFRYGVARFCTDAAAAGVDGLLLVDLPPEEAGECRAAAGAAGLDLISLLTPTADAVRISRVVRQASGFIYYVSVTGVTGARQELPPEVTAAVGQIKERTRLPVVVGFGISTPAQAAAMGQVADGVVVGSALVKLFEQFQGAELQERLVAAVQGLKAGLAGAAAP